MKKRQIKVYQKELFLLKNASFFYISFENNEILFYLYCEI